MFKFDLGQAVKMSLSEENGVIIGRAEYTNSTPSYLVRYRAGDGRQVEGWHTEDAIVSDQTA